MGRLTPYGLMAETRSPSLSGRGGREGDGEVCMRAALPAGGSRPRAPGPWTCLQGWRLREGTVHRRPAAPGFTLQVQAAGEAEWETVPFTDGSQACSFIRRTAAGQRKRSAERGQEGHASPGLKLGPIAGHWPKPITAAICKVCVPPLFWKSVSRPIVAWMASSDS